MRKIIVLLVITLFMIGCRDGRDGADGYDGKDGTDANWSVKTFNIKKTDWKLMGTPGELHSFYYYDCSIPELTDKVFYDGITLGYIHWKDGNSEVKNGLPYVLHDGASYDDLWTTTYDFDSTPGSVRFYVTYSDFMTSTEKPGDETFSIVLMWK